MLVALLAYVTNETVGKTCGRVEKVQCWTAALGREPTTFNPTTDALAEPAGFTRGTLIPNEHCAWLHAFWCAVYPGEFRIRFLVRIECLHIGIETELIAPNTAVGSQNQCRMNLHLVA